MPARVLQIPRGLVVALRPELAGGASRQDREAGAPETAANVAERQCGRLIRCELLFCLAKGPVCTDDPDGIPP